jgi:YVTN family beta-propeller protein
MKTSRLFAASIFSLTALTAHAAYAPASAAPAAAPAQPAASSDSAKPAAPAATGNTTAAASTGPYSLLKEIPIDGAPRWDYLAVDSAAHRLYVSHGTSFEVIDLDKDAVIGNITGLAGVHGMAFAPKLGLGFITNGQGGNVSVIDLKTLKTTKNVPTGTNPDWILFEPTQNEVYAFNGKSQSTTVIDAATGNVTATIPLGGKPETAMVDPAEGRIYDNLEDKFSVAVVDVKTHKVVTTWPALDGKGGSGMAIDTEHHKLFLGCEDTMVMMDDTTGKVLAKLPAAAGIDAAAFDPGTQYAFTSGGAKGAVTIAKEDGDKLTLVQTLVTLPGARTMAVDPATHKIYLAASSNGAFKILVYGMDAKPAAAK